MYVIVKEGYFYTLENLRKEVVNILKLMKRGDFYEKSNKFIACLYARNYISRL